MIHRIHANSVYERSERTNRISGDQPSCSLYYI